jgi:hypothetical protein
VAAAERVQAWKQTRHPQALRVEPPQRPRKQRAKLGVATTALRLLAAVLLLLLLLLVLWLLVLLLRPVVVEAPVADLRRGLRGL